MRIGITCMTHLLKRQAVRKENVLSSVGLLVDCAHLSPGPLKQNAKSSLSHLYQVHAAAICGECLDMPRRGFHDYPISLPLAHRTALQGKVLSVPIHCSDPV